MLGFNVALSKIEVGIAYAVWSALGTIVVTYIGIVCFHESFDLYKLLCLSLILAGVIGLNLREDHP
jgi:small multidrug resistance pump